MQSMGGERRKPKPRFGHGAEAALDNFTLVGSYHVSQQNTFTGKLTPEMFDEVVRRAIDSSGPVTRTDLGAAAG